MSHVTHLEVVPLSEVPLNGASYRNPPVVLVVDDERTIADTLSVILAKNGFAVLTAYDARSALELAHVIPPDLLLSDVVMRPDMDGTELAIAVVTAIPDCRILLFSGHAATVDLLVKARGMGHDFHLLTKPVHPADLLVRIRESLASSPQVSAGCS